MKVFIKKISVIFFLVLLVLTTLFVSIIEFTGAGFSDTYQSVIVRKYNQLITIDTPKIIIIGGSSSGFGINDNIIKDITGYEVVNLGLHAGFGANFPTQLSKANINKGDIVILAYEYGWNNEDAFDTIGVDLVMSGIDNNISMYKHIRPQNFDDIIDYLLPFANIKSSRISEKEIMSGVYSEDSFDDRGMMILDRHTSNIEEVYDIEVYGQVDIGEISISKESRRYLINYRKFVEKNGGEVFFTAPPLMKSANLTSNKNLEKMIYEVEKQLGIEYISNPLDYMFESKYMYDTIYHLNSEGEKIRSINLAMDINKSIGR